MVTPLSTHCVQQSHINMPIPFLHFFINIDIAMYEVVCIVDIMVFLCVYTYYIIIIYTLLCFLLTNQDIIKN